MNKEPWLKRIGRANDERGAVLVTGLLFMLVLVVLSIAAMMSTATELRIAANDRSAKQVFSLAEAGLEDARSGMQLGPSIRITDTQLTNPNWTAFIGYMPKAVERGYDSGNSSHVSPLAPLLGSLNSSYVVTIAHKLYDQTANRVCYPPCPPGNTCVPLKWGDGNPVDGIPDENTTVGSNIYVINAEGYNTATGASKTVRIEAARFPPASAPAALYTKNLTTIAGTSTYVDGMDHCGSSNVPGIITMQTVTQNGTPDDHITGSTGVPSIEDHSSKNVDIQYVMNQYMNRVNYSYNVNSAVLTGMNWGNPTAGVTQQDASSCSTHNVVYFNTNSTYVKLAGTGGSSSRGCGILMVNGDLIVDGGFQWYGVILVTGSIIFRGGAGKNVTGAILAGGTVAADLVSGDANIIYCSQAVNNQTNFLPLVTLRWLELFS